MSQIKINFQNGLIVILLFTVLGLAVYWNALDNPFEVDDLLYVTENTNIRAIQNIPSFFTNPRMLASDPSLAGHYRPLVVLSYAVNYAIGGLNPVTYHLTNLIFHIGSAVLIFLIVQVMLDNSKQLAVSGKQLEVKPAYCLPLTANYMAALAAGIIFLVHPFNSEAVNYITARSSVMSGFFYLLGFYCWARYRQLAVSSEQLEVKSASSSRLTAYYYSGSLLAFIAGMLCKEVVITLPVMLLLYDLYGFKSVSSKQLAVSSKQAEGSNKQSPPASAHRSPLTAHYFLCWRTYIPYLPFILMVVIPYLYIRLSSYGGILPVSQRDISTQIFTEAPVLLKYWQMFFIPAGLSLVHDVNINRFLTWSSFLSLSLLLLYIGTAIYLLMLREKIWRLISFFMFWFLVVLLPTTVVSLNSIFQENRGYLAIVSFAVITGIILKMFEKTTGRNVILTISTLITLIYSVALFYRNMTWDDIITINADTVSKAPDSALAYANLAQAYLRNGDGFLALKTAQKGLSVDPDSYNLRLALASGYQYGNRVDDAIQEYKKALSINPFHADVWDELGMLYLQQDDIAHAEICFREGIKLRSDFSPLYYNLGKVFVKKKEFRKAIDAFKRSVKLDPVNIQARYDMAIAFEAIDMTANAKVQYQEIIRIGSAHLSLNTFASDVSKKIEDDIVGEARKRVLSNNGKTVE